MDEDVIRTRREDVVAAFANQDVAEELNIL
jgi:hypothetical protein